MHLSPPGEASPVVRATRRALGLACVVLLISEGSAAAATTVSPAGVRSPVVAVNQDAALAVAWERFAGGRFVVEARTGNGVAGLGPVRRFGKGAAPRVAAGADGTRAIQWVEFRARRVSRVWAAIARPGRSFGRAQLVDERRGLLAPAGIAVQPDGRVVSVHRRPASIAVASAPSGGRFGRPRLLARTGSSGEASVGVDPRDGTVLVGFSTPRSQAAVAALAADAAGFSPPVVLSGRDFEESLGAQASGRVVSGPAGAAVVFDVSGQPSRLVRLALRRADGSWSPARTAGRTEGEGVFTARESAALPSGAPLSVGWVEQRYEVDRLLGEQARVAAAQSAGESDPLPAPTALGPFSRRVAGFDLAAAEGDSYAGWAAGRRVAVSIRPSGAAGFTSTRLLSTHGDGDLVLAAAGGRAFAAWQERDRLRIAALR